MKPGRWVPMARAVHPTMRLWVGDEIEQWVARVGDDLWMSRDGYTYRKARPGEVPEAVAAKLREAA